jgi:hypothetical protein
MGERKLGELKLVDEVEAVWDYQWVRSVDEVERADSFVDEVSFVVVYVYARVIVGDTIEN